MFSHFLCPCCLQLAQPGTATEATCRGESPMREVSNEMTEEMLLQ